MKSVVADISNYITENRKIICSIKHTFRCKKISENSPCKDPSSVNKPPSAACCIITLMCTSLVASDPYNYVRFESIYPHSATVQFSVNHSPMNKNDVKRILMFLQG